MIDVSTLRWEPREYNRVTWDTVMITSYFEDHFETFPDLTVTVRKNDRVLMVTYHAALLGTHHFMIAKNDEAGLLTLASIVQRLSPILSAHAKQAQRPPRFQ